MASDSSIRINGQVLDSSCVAIKFAGRTYDGITAAKYGQKRTRAKPKGLNRSGKPVGLTPGNTNAEDGTFTMLRETAQQIRDDLAKDAADGITYGDVVFTIVVTTVFGDKPTITDELRGCAIGGDDADFESDNADPLKEEMPITITNILRNGKKLYSGKK